VALTNDVEGTVSTSDVELVQRAVAGELNENELESLLDRTPAGADRVNAAMIRACRPSSRVELSGTDFSLAMRLLTVNKLDSRDGRAQGVCVGIPYA